MRAIKGLRKEISENKGSYRNIAYTDLGVKYSDKNIFYRGLGDKAYFSKVVFLKDIQHHFNI
ncbi:MAG: hypothetical protein JXR07_16000 [Reichenbachiella sp.]